MTMIQLRRGTASEWTAANPVLSPGEMGVELDTGKVKFGNGSQTWTALKYLIPEAVVQDMIISAIGSHAAAPNPHGQYLLKTATAPVLVLGPTDPIPGGTVSGTVIVRKVS